MFRIRFFVWVLTVAGFTVSFYPSFSFGQSLSDVAAKERARRDKNKKKGVTAREFSDETFEEDDNEEEAEGDATEVSEADLAAPERTDIQRVDVELDTPGPDPLQDESRERKRREAEYRSRYRAANERVAAARERLQVLDGLHYVQGLKYLDENGNVVIESLDHLRRLVDEAKAEVEAAEQAVENLKEEARHGGYPPGWLR